MAAEHVYYWTDHATNRFAALDPDADEIDCVDDCMIEVLAGKHDISKVLFDRELQEQYVFKCGRFAVFYWHGSRSAEITDIVLWREEWG